MHKLVAVAVLLASCEPGPEGPAAIAGSRLRPHVIAGADGSRFQLGIWDDQRKEVCRFDTAEDGQLRCLPVGPFARRSGFFGDPNCTEMVFSVAPDSACGAVKYGREDPIDCGARRLYALARFTGALLYARMETRCEAMPVGTNYLWYKATPIPPADFALGQVEP